MSLLGRLLGFVCPDCGRGTAAVHVENKKVCLPCSIQYMDGAGNTVKITLYTSKEIT